MKSKQGSGSQNFQVDSLKFKKMKKRRWIVNGNSKNPYSPHPMSKTDKHLAFVVFSVIFIYMWIMLVIYYVDNRRNIMQYPLERRGLILDLEKESFRFKINGFEYFNKSPLKRRPQLAANQVWFLRPMNKGRIEMKNLQGHLNSATQVSILIKYHIPWGSRSKLKVSGINDRTHEVVTTELSQYGNGYCTTVIFLGLVNEVV